MDPNKQKALEAALAQIERQFNTSLNNELNEPYHA